MVRSRLSLPKNQHSKPSVIRDRNEQTDITLDNFLVLHEEFLQQKALEGLAPRTLGDHQKHMVYFRKYIEEDDRFRVDRCVNIDVLRGYIAYMVHDKGFKPCTVNLRLRTLKCYLRWLCEEEKVAVNYSKKLKLLKVPEDTIKPLSDVNVRKMLKAPNRDTYSGFRDFSLMIVMLDCGIRVSEALNVKTTDLDLKVGLLNVRPENAKTRIFRQVPISQKTCKLLKELVSIAEKNSCEYAFQSSLGGKATRDNIISHFIQYGKKAGLKVRCTPHVFRHTFATNFVRAGGDIFTLQKILGHSTLAMCRKYIQLDNSDLLSKHREASMIDNYIV